MKKLEVLTPESLLSQTGPSYTVGEVMGPKNEVVVRGLDIGAIDSEKFGTVSSKQALQTLYASEERYWPLQS